MESIYYIVAGIVYSIFIIRFILSWVGGDFDVDTDLDISDVVSFKGLTHFLMGVSGWLSVKSFIAHNIQWYDYLIAFVLGVIFVIILYYVYVLMMKLEHKPSAITRKDLIDYPASIYITNINTLNGFYRYVITVKNRIGTIELPAKSQDLYKVGDVVTIKDYKDSYYII